jgi:hypothetical protein
VIDAMTLLDVEELTRYWINHPPLHLMVAAYLGVGEVGKRTRSPPLAGAGVTDIGAVLAELGSSFTGRDVHSGLAPVVLDFDQLKRKASD